MLKFILIGLPAVIVLFLIVAALQPADFRVTRSASIAAPPAVVFECVNDLHQWNTWSPWARMDPSSKITYEGPPTGVGASFTWTGGKKVGEGRMTITETQPTDRVVTKLEFVKPFAATNIAEFTFQPEGDQTRITWTFTGKNSFMGKVFGLIVNCEKMCGGQFEQGFANLKSIVEAPGQELTRPAIQA
jgi:uncharacterized protein YndB with AHSA1/START domain